ncbi:terminase family protein [Thermosporothrix hazakensis]|jgi:hypothetical protein|uniref:Terminase family protein n=1 Tax=Thermosporothrix hazakensis TaxID=644383 RepID=A0A326U9E0_THEHA|nr:hypothetical protein [Thermosporothrix hazakensis]PZW23529.1 terminase family protein [Thermosporothrix hazakensis]GCE51104.1 hypothetical protein KTH_59730 [Thermosporothrix hazakensis]
MTERRIGWFAREVLGRPLYWYQEEVGDAILESVLSGAGRTFTVMFARQMGKNQLSAVLEAYLLFCMDEGSIVKAAPTYKPQVVNSRQRLLSLLEAPLTAPRLWKSYGYIVGLAPAPEAGQSGPRVLFFSAGRESHIVGATASLLLEVDEAQDVAPEKFDIELKPMASTTNATTVLYGTAWTDDTLLARMRAHNLELERQDGIKRHFEYDWTTLAAINPRYRAFVEGEIARLGADHLSIRTQYLLQPLDNNGRFLGEVQLQQLQGSHCWQAEPDEQALYIAGLDIGGEAREAESHDSTVLTIARVSWNEFDLPCLHIVHHCCWNGMTHLAQYAALSHLIERWNIRRLVVDRTGLGEGLASLLCERFGGERVQPFQFTRQSKSRLAYHLLSLIQAGRCTLYRPEGAPAPLYTECWKQLTLTRCASAGEGLLSFSVDPSEGHDDMVMSLALCAEALKSMLPAAERSLIVRPRPRYLDGPL